MKLLSQFVEEYKLEFIIILIITATYIFATLFNRILKTYLKNDLIEQHKDLTSFLFLKHIGNFFIYVVGFAIALSQIPELKVLGHSLLAGAGVLSLVVGLAAQQSLGNVMSGFLIVIFKPFRINDRITIKGSYTGIVEDINLRQVVIRDYNNDRIVVPNIIIGSDIVVNQDLHDFKKCHHLEIGIGYTSDMDKAMQIMVEEILKHPFHVDARTAEQIAKNEPEVMIKVISLGDSSVNIRAWVWSNNASEGFKMNCDLLYSIKKRFDNEGIEIPFPQRTITMGNFKNLK